MTNYSLHELDELWERLADISVFDMGNFPILDEPFLHFPAATPLEEVWHWFEEQNPAFIIGHKMN